MLDPGSAFVVDVPAAHSQVTWIQSRNTEPDVDAVAHEELAPLQYMRYRNLVGAK
jgi:hypothetical protein